MWEQRKRRRIGPDKILPKVHQMLTRRLEHTDHRRCISSYILRKEEISEPTTIYTNITGRTIVFFLRETTKKEKEGNVVVKGATILGVHIQKQPSHDGSSQLHLHDHRQHRRSFSRFRRLHRLHTRFDL